VTSPDSFDVESELVGLIVDRIASHERSQQRAIGASELGTPCLRKLGLKIYQADPVPEQLDPQGKWRPTVGTAVHEWLAEMLRAENARLASEARSLNSDESWAADAPCHPWCGEPTKGRAEHRDRWLVEYRTPIGTIDGKTIPGNLDAFDRLTGTLIDWKVVGPTAIKGYKRDQHPGEQYEVQGQLYGRGLTRAQEGEDVRYIAIMFLPSNGELKDRFYWEEEYDPEVGKRILKRARDISRLIDEEGESIFRRLKTVDDHCNHCPFFSPGTKSPVECPGDPSLTANMEEGFSDLLPNGVPGA
jgi:hypothetical protein